MNFEKLSDEELLILIREGVPGAQEALFKRYFDQQVYHCRRAAPGIYKRIREWDLNYDYFQVFLKCQNDYRFGRSLFKNYFEAALRHEIYHAYTILVKEGFGPISLDDPLSSYSDDLTLHDVVSSYSEDDPRIYLDYLEEAYKLKKAPKEITSDILDVAIMRGENMTYPEIARRLHISTKMCKDRYNRYCKAVRHIIERGRPDGFYDKKPSE